MAILLWDFNLSVRREDIFKWKYGEVKIFGNDSRKMKIKFINKIRSILHSENGSRFQIRIFLAHSQRKMYHKMKQFWYWLHHVSVHPPVRINSLTDERIIMKFYMGEFNYNVYICQFWLKSEHLPEQCFFCLQELCKQELILYPAEWFTIHLISL
jgi:hypothetical protein